MGAAALFQVDTVWTDEELFDIGYEQAADVMVLTHLKHIVVKLSRYGHADWTMLAALFGSSTAAPTGAGVAADFTVTTGAHAKAHLYAITAVDQETGEESLDMPTGGVSNDLTLHGNFNTVTWTPVAGKSYNIYKSDGGPFGFVGAGDSSGTFRDENVLPDYSDSFPTERPIFNATNEYPGVVTFFEQRMFMGRTLLRPNSLYGSQSANLFNFNTSRPIQPDDAVTFGLLARRVNAILHLVPMKAMIAFTTDAVFSITGGQDGAITPTSINISPEGYRGASKVRPVPVGDVIFFNTARGKHIRTLGYQFERDGYRGNDITVFARHFFKNFTIVDMAWAETPTQTLWCVRSDGKLVALTWLEEQDVWGWSLCYTKGFVESCCVVGEAGEDVLYCVIKREINGRTVRTIERLSTTQYTDANRSVYMDCARTYEGGPVTTINGLSYLEGETVSVLADGSAILGKVVQNGRITLSEPASLVTVGIPYEAWIRTLPFAPQLASGSIKGQKQAIGEGPKIGVIATRGIEAALSRDTTNLSGTDPYPDPAEAADEAGEFYDLITRDQEPLGSNPDLYTGSLQADVGPGDWNEETTGLVIRQKYPLPMNVTGFVIAVEGGG